MSQKPRVLKRNQRARQQVQYYFSLHMNTTPAADSKRVHELPVYSLIEFVAVVAVTHIRSLVQDATQSELVSDVSRADQGCQV